MSLNIFGSVIVMMMMVMIIINGLYSAYAFLIQVLSSYELKIKKL